MSPISNNQIKLIKSLSDKKFRDKYGLFVVEGEKMVSEALASGFSVEEVYRKEDIGEKVMERITGLSSPSPVLALVRKPADVDRESEEAPENGLHLLLDCVKDPGNMGTIIRLADWFGITSVTAAPGSVDIFSPKVVQSTMGALFRIRFRYGDIPRLCRRFEAAGGCVYGTFLDGENLWTAQLETGKDRPVAVVIGNESRGISPETAACISRRITIPPFPQGHNGPESLNAAVATGVTIAEFRRRTL